MRTTSLFKAAAVALAMNAAPAAIAQYNHVYTYYPAGNPFNSFEMDVVNAMDGSTTSYTWGDIQQFSSASANTLVLKNIDFFGNTNWDRVYNYPEEKVQLEPERMIHTKDGEYIVVGYYHTEDHRMFNPFACRFDKNGKFIWGRVYKSNDLLIGNQDKRFGRMDIKAVENEGYESYFITCHGHAYQPWTRDDRQNHLNVLKIYGDGKLEWNKKYHDAETDYRILDFPSTMTFAGKGDEGIYFIAGIRFENYEKPFVFYTAIDKDGNLVRKYAKMEVPSYSFLPNALYNRDTREIVMAYTFANNNLVGISINSEIAVSKFDLGLTLLETRFYWHKEGYYNEGLNIKRSLSDDTYVIGLATYDNSSFHTPYRNIGLLKIKTSGSPIFFWRYNIERNANFESMVSYFDASNSTESYNLVGTTTSDPNPGLYDVRILNPDINGKVCGATEYRPYEEKYELRPETIAYKEDKLEGDFEFKLQELDMKVRGEKCDDNNPNHRQALLAGNDAEMPYKLYPTVLSGTDNTIRIDMHSNDATSMTAMVYDMQGRILASKNFDVNDGSNAIFWQLPDLTAGNYIIVTQAATGERHTTRISRL